MRRTDSARPHRRALAVRRPALLLACGNTLRQDDGVGLRIALAAEKSFPSSQLRVIAAQQLTPEMAADLANTDLAIFVDACVDDEPGSIRVSAVAPGAEPLQTHRLDPPALLALAQALWGPAPAQSFILTIGAGHLGYGEDLSAPLRQAIPRALRLLTGLLDSFSAPASRAASAGFCILPRR